MSEKDNSDANRLLEGAYAINTAQDNVDYYRKFAAIYDEQYADRMGYVYPSMLADVYIESASSGDTPVADIGCGTGLVAEALINSSEQPAIEIDAIDISPEMLKAAKAKMLYRELLLIDLTQSYDTNAGNYGAIVSAGTFTFGHLGPEILRNLLALGRQNTLYCIGVNSEYYQRQGFSTTLESMHSDQLITKPVAHVRQIYNPSPDGSNSHANDAATVLVYRQQ